MKATTRNIYAIKAMNLQNERQALSLLLQSDLDVFETRLMKDVVHGPARSLHFPEEIPELEEFLSQFQLNEDQYQ
jgi:hypothetical protein